MLFVNAEAVAERLRSRLRGLDILSDWEEERYSACLSRGQEWLAEQHHDAIEAICYRKGRLEQLLAVLQTPEDCPF